MGCKTEQHDDRSPTAEALATASMWAGKPNMVWSLIHFLMHNQPSPMPQRAVEACRLLRVTFQKTSGATTAEASLPSASCLCTACPQARQMAKRTRDIGTLDIMLHRSTWQLHEEDIRGSTSSPQYRRMIFQILSLCPMRLL